MSDDEIAEAPHTVETQSNTVLSAALRRHRDELTDDELIAHTDHTAFSSNPW